MGKKDDALKWYTEVAKIVKNQTESNLKFKFGLDDDNISHIKSSIKKIEKLVEENNL